MKRIRSAKIRGKRVPIQWRSLKKDDVLCYAHQHPNLIEIDTSMDEKLTADTLTHEALHIALPDLDEEVVNQIAIDIITMLDRADLIKADE